MFKLNSLLTLLFVFVLAVNPLYAETSISDTLKNFETELGMPHTGTLIERLNKIEMNVYGETNQNENIYMRCGHLEKIFATRNPEKEIIPKLHNQMEKVVADSTNCVMEVCQQKGVVQYYRDGNYMSINTLDNINKYGNNFSKKALGALDQFLIKQTGINNPDLGTVFNYCIENVCVPLGEIPNVKYTGMFNTRAIYTIDTEETFEGNIGVKVYGTRGDDYVLLSKSTYLKTHDDMTGQPMPLYQQCLNELGIKDTVCNTGPFMECYKCKLKNNKEIQAILKQQTDDLIDFFAL